MISDKYYTVKELCQLLKRDKSTIYKWIREGKLKAIKVGGKYLIPEEEVKKILSTS